MHEAARHCVGDALLVPRLREVDEVHVVRQLIAGGECVRRRVRCHFAVGDDRERFRVVKLPVFFWRNPGQVRPDEAQREEERFLPLAKPPEVFDCQVRTRAVDQFVVVNYRRGSGRAAEVVFSPVVRGQLGLHLADARLPAFRITPLRLNGPDWLAPRLRVGRRVVINLPVAHCRVAVFAQPLRQRHRVRLGLAEMNRQRPHSQRVRPQPGHQTRSRGIADGHLAMRLGKPHPALGQAVEVRCDGVPVPIATDRRPQIIHRDEENIGLGRAGRSNGAQQQGGGTFCGTMETHLIAGWKIRRIKVSMDPSFCSTKAGVLSR